MLFIPNTSPNKDQEQSILRRETHLSFAILHLGALLRVDASSEEGCLPGVDFVLSLARQLQDFEVLVDVPVLRVVDGEHVAAGHEPRLDVAQLQSVEGQHEFLVTLLR